MTAARNPRRADGRGVLAYLLALAAVAAAAAAAWGPAVVERARLSWPPTVLPAGSPTRTWVAPMLIAREWPWTLDARLPCADTPKLSEADSVVVFATARNARAAGGLEVVRSTSSDTISVRVGKTALARLATDPSPACSFRLHFRGGAWTIDRPGEPVLRGTLATPPRVYGLLTELDLTKRPPLQVTVEPLPQDTRPSTRQTGLRILAALLLAGAILAVVAPRVGRTLRRPRIGRLSAQDGVVAAILVAWWLLAPLQDDDGWVRARQLNSAVSGGLSNYYRDWGANLPLGTWLEWLQHVLLVHTSSLAYQRLPALAALGATWLVCRWCLTRLLGSTPDLRDVAWWSAALAFGLGVVAFGMTLRPEPLIALLTVSALACCIAFSEKPSVAPLTLALLFGVLAVTIYPSGIVAAAPFVLCISRAIRTARHGAGIGPLRLAALLPIGIAFTTLLLFVDSDEKRWNESRTLGRISGSHGKGVLDEFDRYLQLADEGASPVRRLFVALLVLVALAFVVRALRRSGVERSLPSASVSLSLALLVLTPSKLIWHFGGLVGLCAVAVGFEVHRVRSARKSRFDRVALLVPLVVAAVWSTSQAYAWAPLDAGSIEWVRTPVPFAAAVLAAFCLVLVAGRVRRVHRPELVVLPAVLGALTAVTMLVFTVDAAATNGWTTARQTMSSLVGRDGCGVASSVDIALPPASARVVSDRRHAWHVVPRTPFGVFVGGTWSRDSTLVVDWGRRAPGGVRILRSGVADLAQARGGTDPAWWRFVAEPSFPRRPAGANVFRFAVRPVGRQSNAVVSAPLPFVWRPLDSLMEAANISTLAGPTVFPALPCARLPGLEYGVADVPDMVVNFDFCTAVRRFSCTFKGLANIFELERLPHWSLVGDQWLPVYRVRLDPRDAIAAADRSVLRAGSWTRSPG